MRRGGPRLRGLRLATRLGRISTRPATVIVADVLRRIGKFAVEGPDAIKIEPGPTLGATAYRSVLRAAVVDGRAGFRKERSHQMVAAEHCLVAHPLAEELLIEGRFPGGAKSASSWGR